MPELPDITVYQERLAERAVGAPLQRVTLKNAFLLRTAQPPLSAAEGRTLQAVERLGKRLVLVMRGPDEGPLLVLHLMVLGRLHWRGPGGRPQGPPRGTVLAGFEFATGTLWLTESGTRRQASLHLLPDRAALAAMDPGGIDPLAIDTAAFAARLALENRTLKRALTDPRLFSGIGNAYSDEILHRARLSPLALTRALDAEAAARLHAAACGVLCEWTERLRNEADRAGGWPDKVTAFHPQMAVHGRFGEPCPDCGAPVQRVLHAENEMNYCARCQTGGRLLADRALSRLLHDSWPKTLDG